MSDSHDVLAEMLGRVLNPAPSASDVASWHRTDREEAEYFAAKILTGGDPPPLPKVLSNWQYANEVADAFVKGSGDGTPVGITSSDVPVTSDDVPEPRGEDWHITVEGVTPIAWLNACAEYGVKPLMIELPDGRIQLMSETGLDPAPFLEMLTKAGVKVVRVKHEVTALREGERALYWEVHVKFDGPYRADRKGASRDLYRSLGGVRGRWYLTRRSPVAFDATEYLDRAAMLGKGSLFVGAEYEACLSDTNPALDADWL